MPPIVRFFLPCDKAAKLFYVAEVYHDHESMLKSIHKLRGKALRGDEGVRACCLRYVAETRVGRRLKVTGELGTLFFVRGDASPEVVVHELTHAACGWATRTRTNPLRRGRGRNERLDHEEKFADVMQRMARNYYAKVDQMLAAYDAAHGVPTKGSF